MSLPSSGPISMSMILTELGYTGSLTNISLSGSETGLYGAINFCSPSHPNGTSFFSINEWYSYNNNSPCILPPPTASVGSSWYWQYNFNNFALDNIGVSTGSGLPAQKIQIFYQIFPTGSTLSGSGDVNGPFTISSGYGTLSNPVILVSSSMGVPYSFGVTPNVYGFVSANANAAKGVKVTIQTYNTGSNLTGSTSYQVYRTSNGTGNDRNKAFIDGNYPSGVPYLSASQDGSGTRVTLILNGCTTGSTNGYVAVGGQNLLNANGADLIYVGPSYPTSSYTASDIYGTTGTDYTYYIDDLTSTGYVTSSLYPGTTALGTPITQFKFP
jgi:hypothetical protein